MFFVSFSQYTPINKRLAPKLRRLKMYWIEKIIKMKSIDMLFESDVLFSLTNFTFLAPIDDLNVLHHVLSKLSSQCLYRFDVTWCVMDDIWLSDTSDILSNTFDQLKGSIPIELEVYLEQDEYSIRAMTLPRMDVFFPVDLYLRDNIVHG